MHFSSWVSRFGSIFLALLIGCAQPQVAQRPTTAPATYREADEVRDALTYLASDQLEGRGLETEGIGKAADYIATQFRKDGLRPLPALNGYFQEFPITLSTKIGKETKLEANGQTLTVEKDFSPVGNSAEKSFSGSLAFVGY